MYKEIIAVILIMGLAGCVSGHKPTGDKCASNSDCKCVAPKGTLDWCGGLGDMWGCVEGRCKSIKTHSYCESDTDCTYIDMGKGECRSKYNIPEPMINYSKYNEICKCISKQCSEIAE
jgi:hypothetical protein